MGTEKSAGKNISYKILWFMGFNVSLYEKNNGECPVLDFIQKLKPKELAKIYREIDLLEEFGEMLNFPHVRKIAGEKYKGLWELRIKHSSNNFRIFYFVIQAQECVLIHCIKKKSQKTPPRELSIALIRMNDLIERRKK